MNVLIERLEIIFLRSPILPLRGNVLCALSFANPMPIEATALNGMIRDAKVNANTLKWGPCDGMMVVHVHGGSGEIMTNPACDWLAKVAQVLHDNGEEVAALIAMRQAFDDQALARKHHSGLCELLASDCSLEIQPAPAPVVKPKPGHTPLDKPS